jgi:hypothetical protein
MKITDNIEDLYGRRTSVRCISCGTEVRLSHFGMKLCVKEFIFILKRFGKIIGISSFLAFHAFSLGHTCEERHKKATTKYGTYNNSGVSLIAPRDGTSKNFWVSLVGEGWFIR